MRPCLDVFSTDDHGELVCIHAAGFQECNTFRSFFAQENVSYLLHVYGYVENGTENILTETGGDFNLTVTFDE
jgi:hypothetical protein